MDGNWGFNSYDEEAVKDLKSFLPEKVFDMHAHIYRVKDLNLSDEGLLTQGPDEVGISVWQECIGKVLGRLPQKALVMPFPTPNCDIGSANNYLADQLNEFPEFKGLILITPGYPVGSALELLKNRQFVGFKPYHHYSCTKPTSDSAIDAYVPEWVWEIANERNLAITLHIVKDKALADKENQRQIREKCSKYPAAKLILAHAGRGFNAYNTIYGLEALKGLENVWFDTSGICEAAPIKAIYKEFGKTRLLWGSDFPVSQIRGKCVTVGQSFLWIQQDTIKWENLGTSYKPVLVGIESLRAFKEASEDLCLGRADIEDIFYNNALVLCQP